MRTWGIAVLAVALTCAGVGEGVTAERSGPPLFSAGAAGAAFGAGAFRVALPPDATGSYVAGTSLLDTGLPAVDPLFRAAAYPVTPSPADLAALADRTRDWLAAGWVPGRTPAEQDVATRALLDLALLTGSDGASVASPFGPWDLVWPRDASWHAVAFAVTAHPERARAILEFLARTQRPDGTWDSRYRPDGRAVSDGRPRQLDAVGWVPWAVWSWWQDVHDEGGLRRLWPMVSAAADVATDSLGPDGLPRPSADYWEQPESRPTLGTAAPLLLGLRSAAALATDLGEDDAAARWRSAARRLDTGIAQHFGSTGYRRYPQAGTSPDSAVTFLAAPLAPPHGADEAVEAAVRATADALLMPSGGLRPGNIPRVGGVAWTPATALFALAAAGRGDEAGFRRWFDWLAAHRTSFGAFPEKVTNTGNPASVAPLGWTSSIVLIALATRDGRVPAPPP
jgi:GH15 family glucan-1,4-alpha-glucosidase